MGIAEHCTFAPEKLIPIGVWCNGNTADSGPAFPGSSPGTPTPQAAKFLKELELSGSYFARTTSRDKGPALTTRDGAPNVRDAVLTF